MQKSIKRLALSGLAVSLAVALGACGLVSNFIPDQPLDNPMGVGGAELELALESGDSDISVQAVSNVFSATASSSFANQAVDVPSGLEPSGFKEDIGIGKSFVLATLAPETDLPAALTLTNAALDLKVSDETYTVTDSYNSGDALSVSFARGACSLTDAQTTCTYSAVDASVNLLKMRLSGNNFLNLFSLLNEGTADNAAEFKLSLSFDSDNALPADSTIVVETQTANGTLTF